MVAEGEDNRLIAIGPDTDNPVYGGYTCVKGRQLVEQIYHPERLQQSQIRQADGSFASIETRQALDEIAAKLQDILAQHGPRSIASYNGTYSYQNSAAHGVARAFHGAIDSPSYYASVTIDQPAKVAIGPARMGWWGAGSHMWNGTAPNLKAMPTIMNAMPNQSGRLFNAGSAAIAPATWSSCMLPVTP